MSSMLSRIVAVSVAVNTSGTYAAGTSPGMSSAIHQFRNTAPIQLETNVVDLQELRQTFTKSGDAVGRQLYKLTPGLVAMSVGSTPDITTGCTVFRLGKILRMCGMSESASVTGGVSSSLTYTPRSSGFEDGLIDCQLGDTGTSAVTYKMKGVYGTAVIAGSAAQVITVDPTLTGIIGTQPTKVTAVTPALPAAGLNSETMKSEGLSVTTSGGTYVSGTAFKFKKFSLDMGVDVQEDSDANAADGLYGLLIAGRKPTLDLTIGMDSASTSDFYADYKSGFKQTITFLHGTVAGRFMRVTCTGQLNSVTITDDVGLRTLDLKYNLVSDTNEGEYAICFS